ncbi:glycine/betaine ABC transporter permease [Ammoniphilus oxalaticus]|uniref:Glycine/betaine ABC transporter permease n=1 Tax=Ammoniphilus oxalaticus TaxID=66863 RepID=A0A419SP10_9BACL|nr:BCCT family transporter [Ammoniphilus oxalaticus]RKD25982.1 glycine/betaine ABC transporter permease [Ammoniphilus oxalaticus]
MKQVSSVFWVTLIVSILFVLWGAFFPDYLQAVMNTAQVFFLENFGWYYQLAATFFLLFALFLIFSPYGKIKLGKDDDKPDFSRPTWFAMLFSAGMGIGLVFFGVSEPISHYVDPPMGAGGTPESVRLALRYTYLHWGFHAWGIYAVIALAIAYFKFRKGLPSLMSATLTPILGDRANGLIGKVVDMIAVFATIFGVAASLGLGAGQINSGISYLTGIPNSFGVQLIIIAAVTVLFLLSAATGVKRGIKYLSNANLGLAIVLFITFFILAPTVFLLNLFTTTFGEYIQNLLVMGTWLSLFNRESAAWLQNWTIFYWAWWIAWAPFVGTFIARVSKGRTVREFVIAVLVAPTLVCSFWFAVFGGTGIYMEHNLGIPVSAQSLETALFYVYEHMPFTIVLVIVTLFLVSTFFITSADSATFVLGMQTTNGGLEPPNSVKFIWGIVLSASAAALLYSGGLPGFQTTIIVSAFPLSIVLFMMVFGLLKSFREEVGKGKQGGGQKEVGHPLNKNRART